MILAESAQLSSNQSYYPPCSSARKGVASEQGFVNRPTQVLEDAISFNSPPRRAHEPCLQAPGCQRNMLFQSE